MTEVLVLVAGLGVGLVFGMFGAGGSAFATPVLALIGVPPVIAYASPLPAMIPASFAGARHYLRTGNLDSRVAWLAIAGGVPGTLVGAVVERGERLSTRPRSGESAARRRRTCPHA